MTADRHLSLTAPERQVLTLLAEDTHPAAVAHSLAISERTVRNHVKNVLEKVSDVVGPPDE